MFYYLIIAASYNAVGKDIYLVSQRKSIKEINKPKITAIMLCVKISEVLKWFNVEIGFTVRWSGK